MKRERVIVFFMFAQLLFAPFTQARGIEDLNANQRADVLAGKQVSLFDYSTGGSWPKCRVYQRVDITPEEAAAVFFDYNLQYQYVHRVSESRIIRFYNKKVAAVRFGLNLPFPLSTLISTPTYEVKASLSSSPQDGSYEIDWTKIKGDLIQEVDGEIRFEPLGRATLVSYWNKVVPGIHIPSIFQGAVDAAIKRGSGEAMDTIIQRMIEVESRYPNLLQTEISSLRSALQ